MVTWFQYTNLTIFHETGTILPRDLFTLALTIICALYKKNINFETIISEVSSLNFHKRV